MQNIQLVEGKDAVLVPLKDWEKMQRDLVRLRKKVNKEKVLRDIRNAVIEIEADIKNGREPRGRDVHEFLAELEQINAK